VKQKEEFVLKALEPGRRMTALCLEFNVSRQTGYKWVERFKAEGLPGLEERTRRPHSSPVATSGEIVLQVLELRRKHGWGPKKLHKLLSKRLKAEEVPSRRTIARILDRAGESKKRRERRASVAVAADAPRPEVKGPNDLWTVDFKGWWRAKNGARCEPLTVRDAYSRFILCTVVLASPKIEPVRAVFERLFEQYGVPKAILSDNGNPFACTRALAGLTELSAWWVSLGIEVLHSRPGCPQDNGSHERMHADMLPLEAQSAAGREAQQVACDKWRHEFNHIRPHESLAMKAPAEVYQPQGRRRKQGPAVASTSYPEGAIFRRVVRTGYFSWQGRTIFVSRALRGHTVAVICSADGWGKVMFCRLVLGRFAIEGGRQVEPITAPKCQSPAAPPSADAAA
jgi:transposase InsO family protein